MKNRKSAFLIGFLILAMVSLPALFFRYFIQGNAGIMPRDALVLLNSKNYDWLLVDIQTPRDFQNNHISASLNWPWEELQKVKNINDIPLKFHGKNILLICESGINSGQGVQYLKGIKQLTAKHISGGIQNWLSLRCDSIKDPYCSLTADGQKKIFPFKTVSALEEWSLILSSFVIKPLYMLLSFMLFFLLRSEKSRELIFLKWAMFFFFMGEAFCAVNYLVFNDESYLAEYLHSSGMMLCFGFIYGSFFEGLDNRVLQFSAMDKKCRFIGLCKNCHKNHDIPCQMLAYFKTSIPVFVLISLLPLTSEAKAISYQSTIMGQEYFAIHPVIYQIFETRVIPVLALVFFIFTFAALQFVKTNYLAFAKFFFSLGLGFISFSFFRIFLFKTFQDQIIWFSVWEELTEFIFVALVLYALWKFRAALLFGKN